MLSPGSGLNSRPVRLDDASGVTALLNACSTALIGRPTWLESELRNEWQSPLCDLSVDTQIVVTGNGTLAGYAQVWDAEPHATLDAAAHVHPDHQGQGIGVYLAHWLERRARRAIPQAPAGVRVILRQFRGG